MQQPDAEVEVLKLFVIFSAIFILVAVIFIYLIYKFTQTKNQILKEKLENEVLINRTELLALKSQMNPHFVFNALNTVQYFIQQNEPEQSEDFLAKFSQLVRKFFEYARTTNLTIADELIFIKDYLKIEKIRFEEKLNYEIKVDENLDIENTRIPSMILQPIIENAINHGIFHKPDLGFIEISFQKNDEKSYKITILDNGIGIYQSKKLNQTSTKPKGAHSSDVLKERIQLLKESNQWNIDYTIEDLSELNPVKSGTKVTLIFHTL